MKELLRTLIGQDADDPLLDVLLDIAGQKIVDRRFPFDSKRQVPDEYKYRQLEIAAYLYNKRGAEGQTSHKEGDISRTYENADIPESMLKGITPYCEVL